MLVVGFGAGVVTGREVVASATGVGKVAGTSAGGRVG